MISFTFENGVVVGTLLFTFTFYVVFSAFLQHYYFYRKAMEANNWKCQPKSGSNLVGEEAKVPWIPWLFPLLQGRDKKDRAPNHWLFASMNAINVSIIASITAYCFLSGYTRTYYESLPLSIWSVLQIVLETTLCVVHESILEYYWHLLMHLPWFYKRFHKLHHHYKSPT